MSEMGGEIYGPDEGGAGAAEELSEEAKQRFAAAAAARKQIKKEEKKSKQKDDQVAQVIIKFLGSKQHTHLFVLISRLVARDCPSIFILAILSLIHEESAQTVQEYLKEQLGESAQPDIDDTMALTKNDALDAESNAALIRWISTVQQVVAIQPEAILRRLMIDEKNLDGTVLQLTSFVIQEFMAMRGREAPFEKIQPLTASILQTTFQPYMADIKKKLLAEKAEKEKNTDDD